MTPFARHALVPTLAAALASPALAQTAFTPGDTYYRTNSVPGQPNGMSLPGILRLDLASPGYQILLQGAGSTGSERALCYDPWRDRLLTFVGLGGGIPQLWAIEASGGATPLGYEHFWISGLAATGDGRVYFVARGSGPGSNDPHTVHWIDAAGADHLLLDETGAVMTLCPGVLPPELQGLLYDAATRSLYLTSPTGYCECPGGQDGLNVFRLPLTADGSRLSAPVSCTDVDVDGLPGLSSERCAGLSRLPDGDLLVVVDTGGVTFAAEPRLQRLDPLAMALSSWAWIAGPFNVAVVGGAMWSSQLGAAAIAGGIDGQIYRFVESPIGDGWDPNYFFGRTLNSQANVCDGWMLEIPPPLVGTPATISVAAGGRHDLTLNAGVAQGGRGYAVLGSLSGSAPGFALQGVPIPLNFDFYTQFTLDFLNRPPFVATLGVLDAQGHAAAAIVLPPAFPPAMAGMSLTHAAVTFTLAPFQVRWASNPVALQLVP